MGNLQSVIVPEGVTKLDSGAFSDIDGLTVTLPGSITDIADGPFIGCDDLVVVVKEDSYAQEFCEKNGITYVFTDPNAWLKE